MRTRSQKQRLEFIYEVLGRWKSPGFSLSKKQPTQASPNTVKFLLTIQIYWHYRCNLRELSCEIINIGCTMLMQASLVAQMVKNLPAMQETQVQSLGQEDPLQKGMATHSSILA